MQLQAGSTVSLNYAEFNASNATRYVWINVTLTSGLPVFGAGVKSTTFPTQGFPARSSLLAGVTMHLPSDGSGEFTIEANVQVGY